jgi:hypothetical protein
MTELDNFHAWRDRLDIEVSTLDKLIAHLTQLRDATACQSYPGGLKSFGLRKKQSYESGMEDCGK